jgi:hypothetical protein
MLPPRRRLLLGSSALETQRRRTSTPFNAPAFPPDVLAQMRRVEYDEDEDDDVDDSGRGEINPERERVVESRWWRMARTATRRKGERRRRGAGSCRGRSVARGGQYNSIDKRIGADASSQPQIKSIAGSEAMVKHLLNIMEEHFSAHPLIPAPRGRLRAPDVIYRECPRDLLGLPSERPPRRLGVLLELVISPTMASGGEVDLPRDPGLPNDDGSRVLLCSIEGRVFGKGEKGGACRVAGGDRP